MNRAARRLIQFMQPRKSKAYPARRWVMLRRVLLGCGVVSSVLYVTGDIVASLRYPGYRYLDQNFSELLAEGAPTRPLMILLACVTYTALVTAFGVGVWTAGGNRSARIAGALLIGYAVAGAAGGWLFRMNTREVLAAGEGDLRGSLHGPATLVMSLFIMLAMGFGAGLFDRRFRWYTYGTIAGLIVFGIATSLYIPRLETNEPTPWMGALERVNIYATMLWMAVLAAGLLRAHASRSPHHSRTPRAIPQMVQR